MPQDGIKILVSVPSMGNPSFKTLQSLVQLALTCKYPLRFHFIESTIISKARNLAAKEAIDSGCSHVLFIDDDMVFPPEAAEKLLDQDKDIIGALCFGRREDPYPIAKKLYKNEIVDYTWDAVSTWEETTEVDGVGTGFLLIKTEVFKRIQPPFFAFRRASDFGLKELPFPDEELSEDTHFMMKAKMAGYQIWVDPTIIIGHHGQKVFQRPTPKDPVAIFIPTMKRFDLLKPLAEGLKKSTDHPYTLYLISDEPEIFDLDLPKDVVIFQPPKDCVSYSQRINYAYHHTTENYFFTGANDLEFQKNWLENALRLGVGSGVVAVNDTLNPNGTSFLIKRDYIKKHGGTFDGDDQVFWKGYRHNFCDTELLAKAKSIGQWTYAASSFVTHKHWLNKIRPKDEVDQIASDSFVADELKFKARWKEYADKLSS